MYVVLKLLLPSLRTQTTKLPLLLLLLLLFLLLLRYLCVCIYVGESGTYRTSPPSMLIRADDPIREHTHSSLLSLSLVFLTSLSPDRSDVYMNKSATETFRQVLLILAAEGMAWNYYSLIVTGIHRHGSYKLCN